MEATDRATNPGVEVGDTLAGGAPGKAGIILAARVIVAACDADDGKVGELITEAGVLAGGGMGLVMVGEEGVLVRPSSSPTSVLIPSSSFLCTAW